MKNNIIIIVDNIDIIITYIAITLVVLFSMYAGVSCEIRDDDDDDCNASSSSCSDDDEG